MPTFEITTPTGTFEVDAPDESTALDALRQAGEMPEQQSAAPAGGMMSDVVQSLGGGIRGGVESLAGMAGDMNAAGGRAASWLAGKFGASPETAASIGSTVSRASPLTFGMPTTERYKQETDAAIGNTLKHEPQTTAGKYARTVGEFIPAAAIGPGSLAKRAVTQALLPGMASEAAGQATEGTAFEPYARAGAAVAGGMIPSIAGRAISPMGRISPERQKMAQTLKKEGVDLTAGQITGSNRLRNTESELGGFRGQNMMEAQGEQFTKAALRKAGINADRATPEVIDRALVKMGNQFDYLAARNRLVADQQLGKDLRDSVAEYFSLVPDGSRAPVILNTLDEVAKTVKRNGGMTGEAYKALRSRLDRVARASKDPELKMALRGMNESLDEAMERSMVANNSPDLGAWRNVRTKYRNFLVIEQSATGAGENAAMGLISPSQLRNATVQKHGRRNYARGQGDFAELARAGEGLMKPLPNSGTSPRLSARNLGIGMSSIAGGGIGGQIGAMMGMPGIGAAAGVIAGTALPAAVGRIALSKPGRAYLTNQIAAGLKGADPKTLAAIAAILANGRSQPALPPPSE
jgi:hypothetical protein